MDVDQVRELLERVFGFPVLESDAQIVLNRVLEMQAKDAAEYEKLYNDVASKLNSANHTLGQIAQLATAQYRVNGTASAKVGA